MARRVASAELRFWAKVKRGSPDDCWPWIGAIAGGIGVFYVDGQKNKTSPRRYSFMSFYDIKLPARVPIQVDCGSPLCVNPAHLYLSVDVPRGESAPLGCRRKNYIRKWTRAEKIKRVLDRIQAANMEPVEDEPNFDGVVDFMRHRITVMCRHCCYMWRPQVDKIFQGKGCPPCGRRLVGEKNRTRLLAEALRNYERYGSHSQYKKFVRTLTEETIRTHALFAGEDRGLRTNHVDHRRSQLQCFKDRLSPEVTSCCFNLELLPWNKNVGKRDWSSITKEDLMSGFEACELCRTQIQRLKKNIDSLRPHDQIRRSVLDDGQRRLATYGQEPAAVHHVDR